MSGGRDARSAALRRVPGRASRAVLPGWTWRDLRQIVRLGRREGASGVALNKHGVKLFFAAGSAAGLQGPGLQPGGGCPIDEPSTAARAGRAEQEAPTPMETSDPAVRPASKRQLRSAARLQEFQQARRLKRLRGILLRAVKRVRFDRMWRVHNEWYAARARSTLTCDSRKGGATPMEAEAAGATRTEALVEQRPKLLELGSQKAEAADFEFVPGLPNAVVESAWRGAAATWSMGSAATPNPSRGPGTRQPRKARRSARGQPSAVEGGASPPRPAQLTP